MFRHHLDDVISLYKEVPFRLKLEEGGATVGAGREGWGASCAAGCEVCVQGAVGEPGGREQSKLGLKHPAGNTQWK